VELFEEIRREYEFGIASVAGVARKFGVHRRLVREALGSAVPQKGPTPARPRPTIGPLAEFIDAVLEPDRRAPRKQRHIAHRIWVAHHPGTAGLSDRRVDGAPRHRRKAHREENAGLGLLPRIHLWIDLADEGDVVPVDDDRRESTGRSVEQIEDHPTPWSTDRAG
jgi:hypothetical protein